MLKNKITLKLHAKKRENELIIRIHCGKRKYVNVST